MGQGLPKKPEAIFFDWDGTLVDSFSLLEQAHNHVLGGFGMPPFEKGGFKPYFGRPREELYPAIYAEKAEDARHKFEDFYVNNHTTLLNPMGAAEDLLKVIRKYGIMAGVVTNKKPDFVRAEIEHLGWGDFFESVVGAREATNDKPSGDPLVMALGQAGYDGDIFDVWYVGDTLMDQKCAKNAGSFFVFVDHEETSDPEILSNNPDLVVKNCTELLDFLLQYAEN